MLFKTILFSILAAVSYNFMVLIMKLLNNQVDKIIVVFFRFLISTLWVVSVLWYKKNRSKEIIALKTEHLGRYFFRAIFTISSMLFLNSALKFVAFANAVTLNLTYTLFIPLLGYIFFHHKTNFATWGSIILGFCGIAVILNPNLNAFNPLSCLALASGVMIALSLLQSAELLKYDSLYTVMTIHFSLTLFIVSLFIPFYWVTPSYKNLLLLVLVGIMGTLYQEFITRATKYGSVKLVGLLQYSGLIFSGFLDWWLWDNQPSPTFIIGSTIILFSCMLVIHYHQK